MSLFEPPTYDEHRPRGGFTLNELPRDESDGPTWEDKHTAPAVTVKTRKRVSALASSFHAVMKVSGVDDACRALDLDPNEIRRLYLVLVESMQRAEYKAEAAGQLPSNVRRCTLPAYVAELYYKRRQLPRDLAEDERRKRIDTLARNWRRRLKRLLAVQRHTHLGLFDYQAGEAATNKKVAPAYIDRLTDLLADVSRRAAQGRGEPIGRYDRAAAAALADFRAQFPPFAPEWTPATETEDAAPKVEREARPRDRRKVIASAARQCVGVVRALIAAEGLTGEDAERLREELHAAIETEWAQAPAPEPTSPQGRGGGVTVNADTPQKPAPAPNLDRAAVSYLTLVESAKTSTETEVASVENVEIPKAPEEQASTFINALESAGANRYKAVFLTAEPLDGKARWAGDEDLTSAAHARSRCLAFVERSERRSESISLRVWGGGIVQLDDVNPREYPRLAPFCFAGVETSEGNVNLFLSLGRVSDEARTSTRARLLRQINPEGKTTGTANGGSYGAVRLPGTLNTKEKHRQKFGAYPCVRLLFVRPGLTVSPLELERAGLLAPVVTPAPRPDVPREVAGRLPLGWPDLNHYKARKWKASDNRPDRSSAEAAWVGAAWRMGWPESLIVAQLERITEKGRGRRDDYCVKTVRNVVAYVSAQPDTRASYGRERMVI